MHVNNKKLLALFGIKWNPFTPDVPAEGLYKTAKIQSFAFRVENLIMDGGIAAVTGDPGLGKSVAMRILDERFKGLKEITVASLERPQSGLADFYREIGERFGVDMRISNRWGGYKALKERWRQHITTTLFRPVLLVDEAQEMQSAVLSELRLLTSDHYDSRRILTIVLAGDRRLERRLETTELLPLKSRIRTRLALDQSDPAELHDILTHVMEAAGNKKLMTPTLSQTLVEHSAGNPRVMMNTASELLFHALEQDRSEIDEKLFFELMDKHAPKVRAKGGRKTC